jgi:hypothetical protein
MEPLILRLFAFGKAIGGAMAGGRAGWHLIGMAYLSENVTRRAVGMNRTQQLQVIGDQSREDDSQVLIRLFS